MLENLDLVPDPDSDILLDPDSASVNTDPKHWNSVNMDQAL